MSLQTSKGVFCSYSNPSNFDMCKLQCIKLLYAIYSLEHAIPKPEFEELVAKEKEGFHANLKNELEYMNLTVPVAARKNCFALVSGSTKFRNWANTYLKAHNLLHLVNK